MRSAIFFVGSGIIGVALTIGLSLKWWSEPVTPLQKVVQLYKQDPNLAALLLERASLTCVPKLQEIESASVRNIIAKTIAISIDSSSAGRNHTSREEAGRRISDMVRPILRTASEADVLILEQFLRSPDMSGTLACVAQTAAKFS